MARLFIPAEQLTGSRVHLDRAGSRHLLKVLRLQVGADICVFDGRGNEVDARIASIGAGGAELELGARRSVAVPAASITLLQALPRGERMDLIVQKTTELGVARVIPVLSARSMVIPPPGKQRRWQTIAQEAARQSGRADVPEIGEAVPLSSALAEAAPASTRLVLWEAERTLPMRQALAQHALGDVTLLVGPEGGLAPDEVAQARAQGFVSVGLGARILRAETAAIVAVALTQASAGGLD